MRLLAQIRQMGGALRRAVTQRFRPGIAVAVACVVALLAGGIVVYLDNAERLARGRELELNQVQVLVEQLSGLEWQALAEGHTDASMMTGFRQTWLSAKQALVRLRSESPSEPRLSRIVLAFDAYVADVDQELVMLSSGAIERRLHDPGPAGEDRLPTPGRRAGAGISRRRASRHRGNRPHSLGGRVPGPDAHAAARLCPRGGGERRGPGSPRGRRMAPHR